MLRFRATGGLLPAFAPERRRENGARCFCCWSGVGSFHPQFAEANDDARDDNYLYEFAVKLIQVGSIGATRSGGLRRGGLWRVLTRGRAWLTARFRRSRSRFSDHLQILAISSLERHTRFLLVFHGRKNNFSIRRRENPTFIGGRIGKAGRLLALRGNGICRHQWHL